MFDCDVCFYDKKSSGWLIITINLIETSTIFLSSEKSKAYGYHAK